MNFTFLVLIAIPLGAYLLIILFQTREIGGDEIQAEAPGSIEIPRDETARDEIVAPPRSPETIVRADSHEAPPLADIRTAHDQSTVEVTQPAPTLVADAPVATTTEDAPTLVTDAPAATTTEAAPTPVAETPSVTTAEAISVAETELETPELETTELAEAATAPVLEATPVVPTEIASPANETIATVETEASLSVAPVDATTAADDGSSVVPPNPAKVSTTEAVEATEADPDLPAGPLELPGQGSPRYAFDYRGRLWVEKKRKSFFRQLRRPQLPPEEPPSSSGR